MVKNLPANARHKRCRFNPWVGKIPWRRAWQPTPVFLPGESHGQRSLARYSPWVAKSQTRLKQLSVRSPCHTHTHTQISNKYFLKRIEHRMVNWAEARPLKGDWRPLSPLPPKCVFPGLRSQVALSASISRYYKKQYYKVCILLL